MIQHYINILITIFPQNKTYIERIQNSKKKLKMKNNKKLLLFLYLYQIFICICVKNLVKIDILRKISMKKVNRIKYKMIGTLPLKYKVFPTMPYELNLKALKIVFKSKIEKEFCFSKHYDSSFMKIAKYTKCNQKNQSMFLYKDIKYYQVNEKKCSLKNIHLLLYKLNISQFKNFNKLLMLKDKLTTCPITYYWIDYGVNQVPRYILQGFCDNLQHNTKCVPCQAFKYYVKRYFCLTNEKCSWYTSIHYLLTHCTPIIF